MSSKRLSSTSNFNNISQEVSQKEHDFKIKLTQAAPITQKTPPYKTPNLGGRTSKDSLLNSGTNSGRSKVSEIVSNPTGFFFNYKNHINFSNLVDQ